VSADLVVTVPARLWAAWIAEGDLPGDRWSGDYWSFYLGSAIPSRVGLTGAKRCGGAFAPARDDLLDDNSPGTELVWSRRDSESMWHLADPDQRVYVVALGKLRGYAPLYAVQTDETERELQAFIRRGGAVAVTVDQAIRGFRGWRYRWWERNAERAFPDWQTAGVKP
jgi:hypothetical protein